MAPGAGATAPAASNAKFCKAAAGISERSSETTPPRAETRQAGGRAAKAAKSAPSNVKSALLTMADYFDAVSGVKTNPEKISEFLTKNGAKYGKAVSTFTTYYATNCTGVS